MTKKRADRIRRRVTCELQLGGRSYRGIVLDLSETGVFVQTEATPPPGTRLRVRLHASGGIEFEVDATVARRQVAPPQLATVVRGGLGLRVEHAAPGVLQADRDGERLLPGRRAGRRRSAQSPRRGAPPPEPAAPDVRPEFRVRAKQSDGPRSRTLKVKARSPSEARKNALAELGRGWEILSVEAA